MGVKAVDDYTLQYTLCKPVPYFLSMLTYVSFMPVYEPFLLEQGDAFGVATGNDTLLYCGAYYLSEFRDVDFPVRFDIVSLLVVAEDRALMRHYVNALGNGCC